MKKYFLTMSLLLMIVISCSNNIRYKFQNNENYSLNNFMIDSGFINTNYSSEILSEFSNHAINYLMLKTEYINDDSLMNLNYFCGSMNYLQGAELDFNKIESETNISDDILNAISINMTNNLSCLYDDMFNKRKTKYIFSYRDVYYKFISQHLLLNYPDVSLYMSTNYYLCKFYATSAYYDANISYNYDLPQHDEYLFFYNRDTQDMIGYEIMLNVCGADSILSNIRRWERENRAVIQESVVPHSFQYEGKMVTYNNHYLYTRDKEKSIFIHYILTDLYIENYKITKEICIGDISILVLKNEVFDRYFINGG